MTTKPSMTTLQHGQQSWDTTVNDNLALVNGTPIPIAEYDPGVNPLAVGTALPNAALYARCVTFWNDATLGWGVYWSDGTNWQRMCSLVTGGFGEASEMKVAEALVDMTGGGASFTATNLIPAGCVLIGITTRVTVAITGPASWQIGDGTTDGLWGGTLAVALNSTTDLTKNTAAGVMKLYTAAQSVVLKPNPALANFTAGKVRVIAHYIQLFAPTS